MNNSEYAQKARRLYDTSTSLKYRLEDSHRVLSRDHRHWVRKLQSISCTFPHKPSVLDMGCGCGQFFHSFRNIAWLVGIDISRNMLELARNPAIDVDATVDKVNLFCVDVYKAEFSPNTFDLIYSIGVLGEHVRFDVGLCNRVYSWLRHDGKFLFTVIERGSRPLMRTLKDRILGRYTLHMTHKQLSDAMKESEFEIYQIDRRPSTSDWKGAHLECYAERKG